MDEENAFRSPHPFIDVDYAVLDGAVLNLAPAVRRALAKVEDEAEEEDDATEDEESNKEEDQVRSDEGESGKVDDGSHTAPHDDNNNNNNNDNDNNNSPGNDGNNNNDNNGEQRNENCGSGDAGGNTPADDKMEHDAMDVDHDGALHTAKAADSVGFKVFPGSNQAQQSIDKAIAGAPIMATEVDQGDRPMLQSEASIASYSGPKSMDLESAPSLVTQEEEDVTMDGWDYDHSLGPLAKFIHLDKIITVTTPDNAVTALAKPIPAVKQAIFRVEWPLLQGMLPTAADWLQSYERWVIAHTCSSGSCVICLGELTKNKEVGFWRDAIVSHISRYVCISGWALISCRNVFFCLLTFSLSPRNIAARSTMNMFALVKSSPRNRLSRTVSLLCISIVRCRNGIISPLTF